MANTDARRGSLAADVGQLLSIDRPGAHLDAFRAEYEKIKRSLLNSFEREQHQLEEIKELQDKLEAANVTLQSRASLVKTLEKELRRVDSERKRAIRSETFALERETNSKKLVMDLKAQIAKLETQLARYNPGARVAEEKQREKELQAAQEEQARQNKVRRRLRNVDIENSPFEEWKKVYSVWAPGEQKYGKSYKEEQLKEEQRRRKEEREEKSQEQQRAYSLYAAGNPAHAHEIVLSHAQKVQGKAIGFQLTPMERAKMALNGICKTNK